MDSAGNQMSFGLMRGLAVPAQETRTTLTRLSTELATGETAEPARTLNYDFSALGLVSRDLDLANSLRGSIERGTRVANAAQAALGGIDSELQGLRDQLVPLVTGSQAEPDVLAGAAEESFERLIRLINTRQDDGAIFAAGRSDVNALSDPDAILAGLRTAASGASGAPDIQAAVETFFAPGGDFETVFLAAGSPPEFAFRVDTDAVVPFDLRAGDERFREALKAVGTLLAVAESPSSTSPLGEEYLAISATAQITTAQEGVIRMASESGRIQAALDTAGEALDARVFLAQQARSDLLGADPYEVASRIQEETARLETIYTLTARLSGLRLTNYL